MPGERGRAMSPEQQIRKQCGFSQGHIDDLKAYRLQITRAYLAGDFAVAFDLALYALCSDLIDRGYRDRPARLCGQPRRRCAARSTIWPAPRPTGC